MCVLRDDTNVGNGTLDLLLPQRRHLDRRDPGLVGPGHAFAGHLRVYEIGLALDRALARTYQRLAQLPRTLDHLAVDTEALGNRRHVHVGLAQIVVAELPGLHHAPARHIGDHARVRPAI